MNASEGGPRRAQQQTGDEDAPVEVAGITIPAADEPLGSPWEDLRAYNALPRLGSLDLAPDGSWLLAGVQQLTDDKTAWTSSLWRIDPAGGAPRRLTRGVEGESASAFLRDGSVVFTAKRSLPPQDGPAKDTESALWCLPALGGEAYVLARREGGWQSVASARGIDRLVCGIGMRAGIDDPEQDAAWRRERDAKKVKAILHEGYPVRFWDHDLAQDTTRFVALDLAAEQGEPALGADGIRLVHDDLGRGLTPGARLASDGSFLVCALRDIEPRAVVRSTLARIDVATGRLTVLAAIADGEFEAPLLSPDDTLVACVRSDDSSAQEAPRQRLHLVDLATGEGRDLAPEWDRWAAPECFSPDGATLWVTADEDGEGPVFGIDVASGEVRRLTGHGAFAHVQASPDGTTLYATRTAWDDPGSIVAIDVTTGEVRVLASPASYPQLPGRIERVETTAADGSRVPGWLCLPEGTTSENPAKLALWVHGGPLNSWNAWSWRWCPWLLVSQGWAVLLPDPALSTGYGRDFIQRGWGRWGEVTYDDIMRATDAVEARDDIDASRTIMMGGSFGGYMANWIATHTDRFKAIVSHASLWNLTTFGPTTDAAWYWTRELSPENALANSPHQFADRIVTPMLVVHGDHDYRVPIGEGLALWWQLNHHWTEDPDDMPHRFLYFPDENHWVLSPQHARVWYETVRAFIETHSEGVDFVRSELL